MDEEDRSREPVDPNGEIPLPDYAGQEIERMTRFVAVMRKLGVVEYCGIKLGPPTDEREVVAELEAKLEEEVGEEERARLRHVKYWSKMVRGSGAGIPPCTPPCACGRR